MSLALPLSGSPIREMIDLEVLADMAHPGNRTKIPTFRQSLESGRAFLKADKAARSVFSYTLRADGSLWLLKVNKNGSWKCEWDFGKLV